MDRLFLDANVLFSAAYLPASPLRRLWELDAAGGWLGSKPAGVAPSEPCVVSNFINIRPGPRFCWGLRSAPTPATPLHLPAKDRPILQAAIAARVTHLLTGDKQHFGSLFGQSVLGVLVLTPGEYLRTRSDA